MGRVLMAAMFLLAASSSALADWKKGDTLEVEWKGKWYKANILEVKEGKYKVHYDGFESSWDEFVPLSRMRKA